MTPRFDLQSHSTHSDGALPAAEVVERAAEAGVELLALSDHDTVSGVSEAIAAGERSACGSSRRWRSRPWTRAATVPRELHILGYDIDHTGAVLTARLAGIPGRPRAAHAAHGRRTARGSASSSTKRS